MDRILFISNVPEYLLKKSFQNAYNFCIFGLLALLLPILLKLTILQNILCFVIFLIFTTVGFRPYKKLQKIQKNPIQLYITKNGLELLGLSLPFHQIKEVRFINNTKTFGIEIIHTKESIFLPFFSKEDFDHLRELMQGPLL